MYFMATALYPVVCSGIPESAGARWRPHTLRPPCPLSLPQQSRLCEQVMQLARERGIVGAGGLWARYHYHIPPRLRLPQAPPNGFAQPPLDAVACNGIADALADRKANARDERRGLSTRGWWRRRLAAHIAQREPPTLLPSALASHPLEVLRRAEARVPAKPLTPCSTLDRRIVFHRVSPYPCPSPSGRTETSLPPRSGGHTKCASRAAGA